MKIAICDDDILICNQIEGIIKNKISTLEISCEVNVFTQGKDVLNDIYDLIFLDIEMSKEDGIEIKNQIGKRDIKTRIVFVTSHDEWMQKAFGINVIGFVKKPIHETEIIQYLEDVIFEIKQKSRNIIVKTSKGLAKIYYNEIVYIEAAQKYTMVHMVMGNVELCDLSISEWEKILPDDTFTRCHRSYIANFEYVEKMSSSIHLVNGDMLEVSRRKLKETRSKYMNYIMENAR